LVYAAWTEGPTKGRDTNTAVGLCNNPSEQVSISQSSHPPNSLEVMGMGKKDKKGQ
jgi:hypothetical protein